ncbi:MAG TPA: hypothetical protein VJ103_02360 [Candidatus Paceibacterota bacterium]|nr:hypothetical protein [Candidatus Paceibacterota bacterium]
MKAILICLTAVFTALFAKSQTIDLAKENDFFGDAKTAALAGSIGAFGGTFASAMQNPAGLALCFKNEFTINPFVKAKRVESMMHKNAVTDERWKNGIGSIGLVYGLDKISKNKIAMKRKKGQWSNLNLGVGFVRTADFNERLLAEGINGKNSLLDAFLEKVNFGEGIQPQNLDPMGAGLAFQAMLIDTIPRQFPYDSVKYFSVIPNGGEMQSFSRERSGSAKSFVVNFAATYGKKLSLGVALTRSSVNFNEHVVYREADLAADLIPYLNSFTYERDVLAVGRGFGLKGGAIFQATNWLNLGLSGQTPMFMNIVEVRTARFKSDIIDRNLEAQSPEEVVAYQIATPSKAIASFGFSNAAKSFTLNLDYEAIDYQSLRVRTPDVAFDQNRDIRTTLKPTANLRVGLEGKIKKVVLRGGVAAAGNPLVGNPFIQMKWDPDNLAANFSDNLKAFERTTLAFGFGLNEVFKSKKAGFSQKKIEYYVDCSFAVTKNNNPPLWLYKLEKGDAPVVVGASIERRAVLTLGVRF